MLTKHREALAHMREAKAALHLAMDADGSRELSVAMTNLETAMLWLGQDMTIRAVVHGPTHPTPGVLPQ